MLDWYLGAFGIIALQFVGMLWVYLTPTKNKYQVIKGRRWEEWYAWHPVTDVHGNRHWRTRIYRAVANTYVDHDEYTKYYYGTIFDVIAST